VCSCGQAYAPAYQWACGATLAPDVFGGAPGAGGAPVTGGRATGGSGGAAMTLTDACNAQCNAMAGLACSWTNTGFNCVADICLGPVTNPFLGTTPCPTEYTTMTMCLAQLTAQQWTCSNAFFEPIPVQNSPCEMDVCTWTCCDNSRNHSLIPDPDVSARCGC
jgi:hypothetical protein